MRRLIKIALTVLVAAGCMTSCFKEPDEQGYLGDGIYLQGADTMYVVIGAKESSSTAWLDNSTQPCHFEIYDVRDEKGEHAPQFFQKFPTMLWRAPYDYLTDNTEELVMSKLLPMDLTPIMINDVNGQIRVMTSTANIGVKDGDVFHVDVKVTNSKGSKILKDYVIIQFEQGAEGTGDFVINDLVNGICITTAAGENTFPYYDQINSGSPDFSARCNNIYMDNGQEKNMRVHKIADTPDPGVHVIIRLLDKNGKMFDPAKYESYTGCLSYIDVSVNRQNTEKGLELDFPLTPWPVDVSMYQYLRGPVYKDFTNLDWTALKADNKSKKIPSNATWPDDDYAGTQGWYVRMRSQMTFYQHGTYEIEVKVPYSTAD